MPLTLTKCSQARSRWSRESVRRLVCKRGVFYFRRVLTEPRTGEVTLSLGTKNYRTAQRIAWALDDLCSVALQDPKMTLDELRSILRQHIQDQLESDTQRRINLPPQRLPYAGGDDDLDPEVEPIKAEWEGLKEWLDQARQDLQLRDFAAVGHLAEVLSTKHSIPVELKSALHLGLLEAEVSIAEEVYKRSGGRAFSILTAPLSTSTPSARKATSKLASELREPFHVWRESQAIRRQTLNQDRVTMRLFIEIAGDLPVAQYERRHISDFLATLRRLPNTYGKSPKDKDRTVRELIEAADAKQSPRLTERTVERHCNVIRQFLQFAYDQSEISKEQREIAERFPFKVASARSQRDQWEEDELIKLFTSPIWTGMKSKKRRTTPGSLILRDARFWLPLLGIYHGNRLEECAQLYRGDIKQEDGIWYMRLTDEGEGQQLKNEPSRRNVPLHPVVLGMGFIEYVQSVAPSETDPIFPDLKPGGADLKRGFTFTKWFSRYRALVGIRKGLDYHSFRHNVTTQLLNNGVAQHLVDLITGHASAGETVGRYYKGATIKLLADAVATIWWPIDFSHLMKPGVDYQQLRKPSTAAS